MLDYKNYQFGLKQQDLSKFNKNKVDNFLLTKENTSYCKWFTYTLYWLCIEIIRESATKLLGIYIGENFTWKYWLKHVLVHKYS